jgi:hypothetical protein
VEVIDFKGGLLQAVDDGGNGLYKSGQWRRRVIEDRSVTIGCIDAAGQRRSKSGKHWRKV